MPKPKTKKKPTKSPARSKPSSRAVVTNPAPQPAPVTATSITPAAAPVVKPRPAARYRRTSLTPAARRGADLVRFVRIHGKRPYGTRGINAIAKLAREVGHLANAELDATQQHN